ncbi:hypothetical protein SPRG_09571 [Saprolegnia parasitica CBS 223.65]|uniref:Uncharacterized protein n=1 Tax=Saprolegnia parasitica (strain CBS 223.65) TaxID=695850 RepID=A0A067CDM9_SAPPC|nr:hypothetical protein SPRG_09571 [Saprolegnia parasitica CBS 223.65]KDO24927.1 hypothetical protein SPRG_09571 [Saprolegnia parasitica CBS 223.65]|eukprot:XP_012204387.1 hypothetical protein SPRG_09571 [Saprolegnia parasitica CBS 223.65]
MARKVPEGLYQKHADDCRSWNILVADFDTEALRAAACSISPAAPSVVLRTMAVARAQPTILESAFWTTAADIAP